MQRISFFSLLSFFNMFLLWGCEKDEQQLVLQPAGTITLTPNSTTVTLTSTTATNALSLSWTPVNYGVAVPVNYAVQFDKVGNQFKAPAEINAGTSTSLVISASDLNAALLRVGLTGGQAGQVEMRVRAGINRPNDQPNQLVFSNGTTLNATPLAPVSTASFLYVPGAYQNWAPEKAPGLISATNNGVYEGFVYIGAPSEFKFTSLPAWSGTNYGAGATADKISTTGGDLKFAAPGYYLISVNTNTLTWSALKTEWSIIGAATPKGWDNGTAMTFDPVSNTWKIDLTLKQDEFKFRANDSWSLNLGDTGADGALEAGGDNIKAPVAGNYTIELDLSKPGAYTYRLIKK